MIGAALSFITGGSAARLVATGLIFYAAGAYTGWQAQGWRCGYNRAAEVERQARDTLRQVERRDTASTTYQTGESHADQTHAQIRERVRIINAAPAAAGQCLGADGLRELGAAIDNNGAPPAPAGPGRTLPSAAPAH